MSKTELDENMLTLCRNIGKDLNVFNTFVIDVENIIYNGFNKSANGVVNFGEMELIEEKMDEMIYCYKFINEKFRKGRVLREKIEEKQNN